MSPVLAGWLEMLLELLVAWGGAIITLNFYKLYSKFMRLDIKLPAEARVYIKIL